MTERERAMTRLQAYAGALILLLGGALWLYDTVSRYTGSTTVGVAAGLSLVGAAAIADSLRTLRRR